MLRDVGVSVVIASYRWPEALSVSLAGALRQTHSAFEILVVEDGTCHETQAVAEAMGDPRVRYHALGENTGSQSAPNAFGIEHAKHRWIAYLGHDDVWDPRHLELLLAAVDRSGASAVHSGCLTIDAFPAERAFISGMAPWTPATFVPPSSLMHRRDLATDRMVWPDAKSARHAIDYQALCELERNGATFASSGAVTVGKIAAAMRLRHRDDRSTAGHELLLEAAQDTDSPAATLERWWTLAGVTTEAAEFVAQPPAAPGATTDRNRRMRGLPPLGPPTTELDPGRPGALTNWHEPETIGWVDFRWTGPAETTHVLLDTPRPAAAEVSIDFELPLAIATSDVAPFRLVVDGLAAALEPCSDGSEGEAVRRFTARVTRPQHRSDAPLHLAILTAPPRQPPVTPDGKSDLRLLGVAFARIAVRPAGAARLPHA